MAIYNYYSICLPNAGTPIYSWLTPEQVNNWRQHGALVQPVEPAPPIGDADALDVTLMGVAGWESTLPHVVAAGRLYVLNGRGEYEQVELASYWREDEIRSVCTAGYEFDEDGSTTRVFRKA